MQQILTILLALGLIAVIFYAYSTFGQIGNIASIQQAFSSASNNYVATAETDSKQIALAGFKIDTFITSGPKNNEIITDKDQITFQFKGTVLPQSTKYRMNFETKLSGVDTKWLQTSYTTRTIKVKPGVNTYTFWVRAKFGTYVDATPAKITFRVSLSPYYGKVKVSRASHVSIVLRPQTSIASEKINITGWKIKTSHGEIIIPKGMETFIPGSSPAGSDILVKKSEEITIFSKPNPFNIRIGFKGNKCFGYLKDSYTSWPSSLPADSKVCPKINKEEIGYLSKDCQNAIFTLESCKPLDYSKYTRAFTDSNCQSYVENYTAKYLSYNACIQSYFRDANFLKSSWYIYMGYDIVCNCNEYIYLYDRSGLLVDKYSYKM